MGLGIAPLWCSWKILEKRERTQPASLALPCRATSGQQTPSDGLVVSRLVHVVRATLGQLHNIGHVWRTVGKMGSDQSAGIRMDHDDTRRSKREIGCAYLVALFCWPVFRGSLVPRALVRRGRF